MSLILVRQEPVKHPYYVDALGVHIASSKELCYVIYNNPLLAMDDFVNDHLIAFIRNELGLGFLAEKLAQWKRSRENPDEMLVIILEECYYYTDRETRSRLAKIPACRQYMYNYLEIITTISSILALLSYTKEDMDKKKELWNYLKTTNPRVYRMMKHKLLGLSMQLPGKGGRKLIVWGYQMAQKMYGFN